jgi:hypothetical protein
VFIQLRPVSACQWPSSGRGHQPASTAATTECGKTTRPTRVNAGDRDEAHRRCERVSRLIVRLGGHGLIAKVPRARLYRVTRYGQRVMTAALPIHDDQYPIHYLASAA